MKMQRILLARHSALMMNAQVCFDHVRMQPNYICMYCIFILLLAEQDNYDFGYTLIKLGYMDPYASDRSVY